MPHHSPVSGPSHSRSRAGGFLWAAMLAGCASGVERRDSGVAVGNPGNLRATASAARETELDEGVLTVEMVVLDGCDGRERLVAESIGLALEPSGSVVLPGGAWCGLWLDHPMLELLLHGESAELGLVVVADELYLEGPPATVDATDWVLRLGPEDWLDVDALRDDLSDWEAEEEDEDWYLLDSDALEQSVVFVDGGADDGGDDTVALAGADAEEDPYRSVAAEVADPDEDGRATACSTAGGSMGGWGLVLALLGGGLRRRRRRAVR